MDSIEQLSLLIRESTCTVFFGGAGVSTESGIPDFRSESGLYNTHLNYGMAPEELLSHSLFMKDPSLFFRYYRENLVSRHVKPNAAHLALSKLEACGLLHAVITQNIDGLHQASGSRNVLELHGSNWRHTCMNCARRYDLDYVLNPEHIVDDVPLCETCGGIVRPDVVLYEEMIDDDIYTSSSDAVSHADVMIVGGTSLAVSPANGLMGLYEGNKLVVINHSPTFADSKALLVINDSIGSVLDGAVRLALETPPG